MACKWTGTVSGVVDITTKGQGWQAGGQQTLGRGGNRTQAHMHVLMFMAFAQLRERLSVVLPPHHHRSAPTQVHAQACTETDIHTSNWRLEKVFPNCIVPGPMLPAPSVCGPVMVRLSMLA